MFNQPHANPGSETRSTVYGPVNSWRVGLSLGIDLLFVNSICSFRCVYCQLGRINIHTAERQIFVPTRTVLRDLKASEWPTADIITFSGNGEPTLAANIGEVMRETRRLTRKPLLLLTNSAHLDQPEVRRDIKTADKIFCKLDAVDEETFRWINRPCAGITLEGIVNGIWALRQEYDGFLAIQTMFTRINRHRMAGFSDVMKRIGPDEVQLNLPSRPVPKRWAVDYRGGADSAGARLLKAPSKEEVLELQDELEKTTRIRVVSRYRQ
jgi:wyosine [tRNA(Phe)-imidazoG37] synthetase (radical SAM superfamily)